MAAKKAKQFSHGGFTIPKWKEINPNEKTVTVGGIRYDYNRRMKDALFYIHIEVDQKKLAAEFQKYMLKDHDKKEVAMLKNISDYLQAAAGKYAYIANKGGVLSDELTERLEAEYTKLIALAKTATAKAEAEKVVEEEKPRAPVISIQTRMKEQLDELCGQWDEYLDLILTAQMDIKKFEPYREIQGYNTEVKPAHAKIIRDQYAANYAEAQLVVEWKDAEIKEAFGHLTAKARKVYLEFFEKINTACDTVINTGKATRKPRVKKAPSKEKLIAKLKYKESEPALGLASINPVEVIGAQQLWVYNAKTRKLGCYYADPLTGPLTVKGTSLVGFDESKSLQKTLRKPEELKGANRLARTKFDKLFDDIKTTDSKMNGRLNEHTILIKVF